MAIDPLNTIKVALAAIGATVVPGHAGHFQPGDLRTYWLSFMTGTLLTTAVNKPAKGKEMREANLVVTVGKAADSGTHDWARGHRTSIHRKGNTWVHVFTGDVLQTRASHVAARAAVGPDQFFGSTYNGALTTGTSPAALAT